MKDELHPGVERQLDRPVLAFDRGVERPLYAGEAVVVDAAKADDMRREVAEWVNAALLVFELQPRNAELVDLVLLTRCQPTLDPDKALA